MNDLRKDLQETIVLALNRLAREITDGGSVDNIITLTNTLAQLMHLENEYL